MSSVKREKLSDLLAHYTTLSKSLPALLAEAREMSGDGQPRKNLEAVVDNVIGQMQQILGQLDISPASEATLLNPEKVLNPIRTMLKTFGGDQSAMAIAEAMARFLNFAATIHANYGRPDEIIKSARVESSEKLKVVRLIVETGRQSATTAPVYDYPKKEQCEAVDLDLTSIHTYKYAISGESHTHRDTDSNDYELPDDTEITTS
jgi:hypothetical protein